MGDNIFDRLRRGQSEPTNTRPTFSPAEQRSPYSVQGGEMPRGFRDRPGVQTAPQAGHQQQQPRRDDVRPPSHVRYERDEDGDRPAAYHPPAVRRREDEGDMYAWQPPTVGDILTDLGLRMLEVGIAAASYAIGEEIAYFFKKRRFGRDDSRRR